MQKTEFTTLIKEPGKAQHEPTIVTGWIIGHWGVYKSVDGYNVVYIPLGSGIGTFELKTSAMVIARKANKILDHSVEVVTREYAVPMVRMVSNIKYLRHISKLYNPDGKPKVIMLTKNGETIRPLLHIVGENHAAIKDNEHDYTVVSRPSGKIIATFTNDNEVAQFIIWLDSHNLDTKRLLAYKSVGFHIKIEYNTGMQWSFTDYDDTELVKRVFTIHTRINKKSDAIYMTIEDVQNRVIERTYMPTTQEAIRRLKTIAEEKNYKVAWPE